MLDKILSIEGLGIYRGKDSFASNIDLKKFNVIYGYNGAGKTSLSRALRFLEKKETPECLKEENPDIKISFIQDGTKVSVDKDDVSNHNIGIRVFNSDFVWENIHWSKNGSKGIVTVSKEQQGLADKLANKKKRKDTLYVQINGGLIKDPSGKDQKVTGKSKKLDEAEKACEKVLTDCAVKQIKPNIWCSDKSFNKTKFEPYMLKALQNEIPVLIEEDVEKLQKEASSQQQLSEIDLFKDMMSLDDFTEVTSLLITALKKTASRQAIASLKDSAALEQWLKQGLREHIHAGEKCPVCENDISSERFKELKGHFSTEVEELEQELDGLKLKLNLFKDSLPDWSTPILESTL